MNETVNPLAFWRDRVKASAIHLSASIILAALAAALVYGLWTVSVARPFRDKQERVDATLVALRGLSLVARPDLWQRYAKGIGDIQETAKPATELKTRFPAQASVIDRVLADLGCSSKNVVYLPLVGRNSSWTVFLDPVTAQVVATMPLDAF